MQEKRSKGQRGCGFGNLLRKGLSFAKKLIGSKIAKNLAKILIKNAHGAYAVSKAKYKRRKKS